MGNQRTGTNDLVSFGRKKIEELLADFGAFHKLAAFAAVEFETVDFK